MFGALEIHLWCFFSLMGKNHFLHPLHFEAFKVFLAVFPHIIAVFSNHRCTTDPVVLCWSSVAPCDDLAGVCVCVCILYTLRAVHILAVYLLTVCVAYIPALRDPARPSSSACWKTLLLPGATLKASRHRWKHGFK